MSQHDDNQPQEWVAAYGANLRFLGLQMGKAIRKLEASWHDAQNRTATKQEEA